MTLPSDGVTEQERFQTAVALNYCRAAFHHIRKTPTKAMLVQQQEQILNNLNLDGINDPELIRLYTAVLDEIGDVEIADRERHCSITVPPQRHAADRLGRPLVRHADRDRAGRRCHQDRCRQLVGLPQRNAQARPRRAAGRQHADGRRRREVVAVPRHVLEARPETTASPTGCSFAAPTSIGSIRR